MGKPFRYRVGPFKGVVSTRDPYGQPPDRLLDAYNLYLTDPVNGSGFLARLGWRLQNNGAAIYSSATDFRGQYAGSYTALDGSTINFIVMGGHLFRVAADFSSFEDVTPVGVAIDASITTRVYMVSVNGSLFVTDGVNRPWIASDLTSTPITGTYVDYDGTGVPWTIVGAPWLYQGAVFGILGTVNGIARQTDVSWSEPGLPATGWQQTGYDNNWTLETTSGSVLWAGAGSNTAFYYWRELSIGAATGTVGPDLASSATQDSIAFNVGTQACQTIQFFGNGYFFCDAIGRPYFLVPGQSPDPIWQQMRGVIDSADTSYPTTTSRVATSAIEPNLNLYLVGIWSPTPTAQAAVTELYVFHAPSRAYLGRWVIGAKGAPIAIDLIGSFTDSSGRVTLVILGTKEGAPATNGYVWSFTSLASMPTALTTEGGIELTTEGGVVLTTEGIAAVWQDNGDLPDVRAVTARVGYDDDLTLYVDQVIVNTLNSGTVEVQCVSSMSSSTAQGQPNPSTSQDGTYRLVCGMDAFGRGPQITVSPLTADDQWALESISIKALVSRAGPEDA